MYRHREFPRAREKHKVRMEVESLPDGTNGSGSTVSGWTEDISTGGLRVACRKTVPAGAALSVEISCSHPMETFLMKGHVIWVRGDEDKRRFLVGVSFDGSHEEEVLRWSRTVERRASGR
jgi:hypothetical protein